MDVTQEDGSAMEMSAPTQARILVVEDDSSLRRLLEIRLAMDGYQARSATDGADALRVLEDWLPDVMLTDVMMPRLSGISLCRRVRADPRTAATPIIVLTARVFDSDMQGLVDLGGVTFMNKPFDADALRRALHAALHGDQLAPAGPGAHHAA